MEIVLKILVFGSFAFLLNLWVLTVLTTWSSNKSGEITKTGELVNWQNKQPIIGCFPISYELL